MTPRVLLPRVGSPRVMLALLLVGLAGLATLAACSRASSLEDVSRQVRIRYPTVPTMTVDELASRMESGDTAGVVLLDVRGEDEFAVSHLAGAHLAPDIAQARRVLAGRSPDDPIVVYCSVGLRSAELAAKLMDDGYTNVRNLEGSLFAWANRGLPVYRERSRVRVVHPYNRWWGRLLNEELRSTRVQ